MLVQMGLLMVCGAGWGLIGPAGLATQQTRLVLTSVVFHFFLPVLVLDVLWQADIGWQSLRFSITSAGSILAALAAGWLLVRLLRLSPQRSGAVLLATGFANTTYLGLPLLEQVYGGWTRSVVIQIDLFASTPLIYTLGLALCSHYGESPAPARRGPLLGFLNAPPFWAALAAVALNLCGVPQPDWLHGFMQTCGAAVAPLMIFSLGMALSWRTLRPGNLPIMLPLAAIKLLLTPAVALWLTGMVALAGREQAAAVLDIAMPSMTLGIVLCDRYRLDSALYAMAVTCTTALSMISLPFWHGLL